MKPVKNLSTDITGNELNFSVIRKISMFTILIDKIFSLVINGLADVDRFKWCIQFAFGPASPTQVVMEKNGLLIHLLSAFRLNYLLLYQYIYTSDNIELKSVYNRL